MNTIKLTERLYKFLYINAGVYPFKDNKMIDMYVNEYIKTYKNMDFYLYHYEFKLHVYLHHILSYNPNVIKGGYKNASYPRHFNKNSWLNKLKNKKVLIISSFSDSIQYQYKHVDLQLPEFELITYSSVLSIAGNEIHDSWKTSLEIMKKDISKIDFDIALLSCGGYSGPLTNYIKNIGKQAIYMGGALQILFYIKGKRWNISEDDKRYKTPYDHEIPKNYKLVENGCYW